MKDEIVIDIKRLIMHILDVNLQMPVLSQKEHPLDDEIMEFIEGHIRRILSDDNLRTASFNNDESRVKSLCMSILEDEENYTSYTTEIASLLYDIMAKYPDIPSGDLVCCLFEADGTGYFGMMKFNYKTSFIHYVNSDESGTLNSIVKQTNALPGETQKVDECILINLNDFSMKILEKKYEINGEDQYYLSGMFLDTVCELSKKEKAKIFKKATENFGKKFFCDDVQVTRELKRAISQELEENDVIDVVKVAENAFREQPDLKQNYIEHIESVGFSDRVVEIDNDTAQKVFKKHKIKTDSGIEISLPYDFYKDRSKLEFINNPDGTISIVLKNIGKITSM